MCKLIFVIAAFQAYNDRIIHLLKKLCTCTIMNSFSIDLSSMLEKKGGHLEVTGVTGPQERGP